MSISITPGYAGFDYLRVVPIQFPDTSDTSDKLYEIYKGKNKDGEIFFSFYFKLIDGELIAHITYLKRRERNGKLFFKLIESRPFRAKESHILRDYFFQSGSENISEINDFASLTEGFKTPSFFDKLYHSIFDKNFYFY